MRHGGHSLIDQLEALGVERVFTVPGESFLAALDALRESLTIRTIVCRHEGGAAMMADATGKLTGRPGVCFVTRGPGAANAVSGVYVAHQDQTPLVLFVGLPPLRMDDRSAFQVIDIEALFAPISKWTAIVRSTERIPEFVNRAFQIARSGRPGPVVLGFPEDVLSGPTNCGALEPDFVARVAPSTAVMKGIEEKLASAERPIMLVGGPGWSPAVAAHVEAFAIRFDMPVAAAFRCQDYFDNRHPCYAGHLGIATDKKLLSGFRAADVVVVLGAHLGDITTSGFSILDGKNRDQFVIQVHPDAAELGGLAAGAGLPVASSVGAFAEALRTIEPPLEKPWHAMRRDLRAAYETFRTPLPTTGDVRLEEVVRTLSEVLDERAIVASGAGNYGQFLHRYFVYKGHRTCLAPHSGSMGYGLPAAIAAKLAYPDRPVINFAGDGCFLMTAQEMATSMQYGLPIITIIANNGILGTIRMHQEVRYPGRVFATSLMNPDFAALARSYGATGETILRTKDFEPALRRALDTGGSTVLDLRLDPEAVTPARSITNLRQQGRDG